MPIQIANTSKEIVSRLIRNAFDAVNFELDYIYNEAPKLIQTARDLGLHELAQEMQNEL